jgi:fermentation-respiration switch protein FrsA (DUF1100 family)
MIKKMIIITLLIAGVIVFFCAGARFIAPLMIFMPSKWLEFTPAAINLSFEDITITASDGIRLHGWFIPAENPRATLLFFHGNAGNISHRLDSIRIFNELGLSVFIFDYRGYGQSTGRPSVKGVNLDAIAAWNWLTETKQIPAEKIVAFGRSLGGAVAMELTRSVNPGAIILESTFSSLADMSPFPASVTPLLLGGDFWNSAKTAQALGAPALSVPALCIHSPDDEIVPYNQGRRIYDAIPGEKTFLEIRGGHNGGFMQSLETYIPALDRFLGRHFVR